ncbi:MAG TPA: urate hydroxylase PuuD [Burkholderiales bacterium]|nr:urate hydroxylase PuuD [Burkholderiales bacterium]
MAAFFQSLGKTITAGVVLLIVLIIILVAAAGAKVNAGDHGWWFFVMRWLHVTTGVMWIGLLWYFNFVQTPSMPKIPDAEKPAISKVIAPAALFWFRWAAMATLVLGVIIALMGGYLVQALTLQKPFTSIGIGAWLGIIMWFNVWFVIWPNQKKALGIVQVTPEEKAAAAKRAGMTSRINTMLSIPMLYFMVAQSHGGVTF